MIEVKKEGVLMGITALGFESEGVLNPAIIQGDNCTHLFYRAVSKGNYSSIGYCSLDTPLSIGTRSEIPLLFPQFEYESQGVEDPRIVKIEDLYYLTYTAFDGVNALGALAVSSDLIHFDKQGLIAPLITYPEFNRLSQTKGAINEKYLRYNGSTGELNGKKTFLWNKNLIFFPRKINERFYFLHRVKPDIQIVSVANLAELSTEFWQNYFLRFEESIVLAPKHDHEVSYIGGGCPPIETASGWLLIYHGVRDTVDGYVYSACAALLNLENPQQEIARLPYALFKPVEEWELKGEVNNVCFPTGALVVDDLLYIYYGAADSKIACATLSISALLIELLLNANKDDK